MSDGPNSEILAASELAVKGAKQELNRNLDYTIDSFKDLETLIQQVKSRFAKMEQAGKLTEEIVRSASVSIGAYLGEVIRRKIGGTWKVKISNVKVLIINGYEFSPIDYIFERLTKDINYSLELYYSDVNRKHWEVSDNAPTEPKISPIKTDISKQSVSLSQVGIYLLVGIVVVLLVVGMASPDYGSTVCGGVILLVIGGVIWLWASSNKQRSVTISKAVQKQRQSSYKHSVSPKTNTPISRGQTTVACRSCGQAVARTAPVCPSCGDTYPGLIDKCPMCGSKSVRILPKGFSLGKSVAGAVVAGPLGALGGLHGKNDLEVTCSSCHSSFTIKNHEI